MPSLFATSHVVVERLLEKIKCQLEGHTILTTSAPVADDHIYSKSPRSSELSRSMAMLSDIEINVKKIEKKISEGTLKSARENTNNNMNMNNNNNNGDNEQPPTSNNVNSNNFAEEDRGMLSSVNSDSDLIILEEEITLLMLKDKMDEMRKQNAMNNDSSSSNNNIDNNTNHDHSSVSRTLNVNSVHRRNEENLSPKPWDRKYHPNESVCNI